MSDCGVVGMGYKHHTLKCNPLPSFCTLQQLPGGPISNSADEHPLPANKLRVQYGSCVQFQEPLPGGVIGRGVWSGLCLFHVIYAKIVFGVGTRQAVVMEQVADNVS